CFYDAINIELWRMAARPTEEEITRFAGMFSAMGTGPRLRIMRALLSAHPEDLVVGEIGDELGIPASTLRRVRDELREFLGDFRTAPYDGFKQSFDFRLCARI